MISRKSISRYKFLIPLLFYLLLVCYSFLEGPQHLTDHVPIPTLLENSDYYEGKHIFISNYPVRNVEKNYFILKDWDATTEVKIVYDENSNEVMKKGNIVSLFGESLLNSEGFVKAEWIEVKRNYWWKVFLSPLALLIIGYYLIKEKVWEDLTIGKKRRSNMPERIDW